jgi:hypothetical protein
MSGRHTRYRSSVAIDMNGVDQPIVGTEWVKVEGSRKIWDFNGDFSVEEHSFSPPVNGIYDHDFTISIKDVLNVSKVELALFESDEKWFKVASQVVTAGQTEVDLYSSLSMDGWLGDKFDLRVKLYGTADASATIVGHDDETAYGWKFISAFVEEELVNIE